MHRVGRFSYRWGGTVHFAKFTGVSTRFLIVLALITGMLILLAFAVQVLLAV